MPNLYWTTGTTCTCAFLKCCNILSLRENPSSPTLLHPANSQSTSKFWRPCFVLQWRLKSFFVVKVAWSAQFSLRQVIWSLLPRRWQLCGPLCVVVRLVCWKRDTTIGTYFRSPLHFPLQAETEFVGCSSTAGDASSGGSRRSSTSSTSALGLGTSWSCSGVTKISDWDLAGSSCIGSSLKAS